MWKIWKTTSQTESLSWNQREREACGCGLNIDIDFKICTLHRRETRRLSKKRKRRAEKKRKGWAETFLIVPKTWIQKFSPRASFFFCLFFHHSRIKVGWQRIQFWRRSRVFREIFSGKFPYQNGSEFWILSAARFNYFIAYGKISVWHFITCYGNI